MVRKYSADINKQVRCPCRPAAGFGASTPGATRQNVMPNMPKPSTRMRRADDFDIQPVGVVPPVVERRGSQHGQRAPDRQPCAQRRARAEDPDRRDSFLPAQPGKYIGWPASRRRTRPKRRRDKSVMWAGVQKVSRPMVSCQEMSHMMPTRDARRGEGKKQSRPKRRRAARAVAGARSAQLV